MDFLSRFTFRRSRIAKEKGDEVNGVQEQVQGRITLGIVTGVVMKVVTEGMLFAQPFPKDLQGMDDYFFSLPLRSKYLVNVSHCSARFARLAFTCSSLRNCGVLG